MKCLTNASPRLSVEKLHPLCLAVCKALPNSSRTILTLASGVVLSAASCFANALGLGDIQAQSYLGQPLKARVNLVNVNSDLDQNYLMVKPLTVDEARNMGAEVFYGNHSLNAQVRDLGGEPFIEIVSQTPIKEPYLSVLIEMRWPSGVVYREYPILLDPPPIVQTPVNSKSAAAADAVVVSPEQVLVADNTDRRNIRLQGLEIAKGKYTVQPGDSLTKISARWVEGTEQNVSDINQWLFDHNPNAFINNDINRLIAGAKLQMPQLSEVAVSDEQNTQASPNTNVLTPAAQPLFDTSEITAANDSKDSELNVKPGVANDVAMASEDVRGLMTLSEASDDRTRELIDMLARENAALRARINKMESSEVLATMRELVVLQQQEIKNLQKRLGEDSPLSSELESLYSNVGLNQADTDSEQAKAQQEKSAQELLLEQNNNTKNITVDETKTDALVELEPKSLDGMIERDPAKRTRLLAVLILVGGILIALFAAMVVYYRKMVKELNNSVAKGSEREEPLQPLSKSAAVTIGRDVKSKPDETIQGIDYDMPISTEAPVRKKEMTPWYGEKVNLEDDALFMAQPKQDLDDDFTNLVLDEDFLNAAREDRVAIEEASLEAMTQTLPEAVSKGAGELEKDKVKRRSDEEVRMSIAEKMAGYSPDDLLDGEAFAGLELDEFDHFDRESYDDIETVIYRAMMYCEFKKFDKARHVIELKMATDEDTRLHEALEQVNALQMELEKKNAS